jgi:integrase/recombinase XerD
MKANTTIIIDKRKALKNGKYPVKLRVTHNRKQQYYPADLSMSITEFDLVMGKNPKGDNKTIKLKLLALEQKANQVIDDLPVFDFNLFKRKLYSNQNVREDVFYHFQQTIDKLKNDNQFGTASNYKSSMVSLKSFKSKLSFMEVTVEFLKAYEKYLLENEKSISTVGIYLRPLRAIINAAMEDGSLSKDFNYPFGSKSKLKYQIPTSKNVKKSLTLSEIKLFFEYKAEKDSWEEKALDFWIFSYLANGMNITDIANLKYKEIDGDYIKFIRTKTKNTNNVTTPITIFLTEDLKILIAKWGNPNKKKENLIFSILRPGDTKEKQRATIQQFTKMMNKYMKIIAEKIGINKPCTTYYARHSFSTVLKRSGANVQYISEALGHSSISTTKSYLDSFEDDTKKEMAKLLTKFD